MKRSLGNIENLVWRLEYLQQSGFIAILDIEGLIQLAEIKSALIELQTLRPLLRAEIRNSIYYFHAETALHFCEVKTCNIQDKSLSSMLTDFLSQVIDPQRCSLYQIILLQTPQGQQLIATFHHILADAYSALHLLLDLLAVIENQRKKQPFHLLKMHSPPLSLEERVGIPPAEIDPNVAIFDPRLLINQTPLPKTVITHHALSRKETANLIYLAKKNNLKVHSILCAIATSTLGEKIHVLSQNKQRILCINPINMRPYFVSPNSKDEMGYLSSRIDTFYDREENTPILTIAHQLQAQFNAEIDADSHKEMLWHVKNMLEMANSNEGFHNLTGSAIPAVLVSNVGVIESPYLFHYFQVKKSHFGVACHGLLAHPLSLGLTVTTFQNEMVLNFHHLNHPTSLEHIPAVIEEFLNKSRNI